MKCLFVTYNFIETPSCRFRTYLPAQSLRDQGIETKIKLIYFLSKRDIDWADIVIFQRIPQAAWYFKRLHLPIYSILKRIDACFEYSIKRKPTGIDLDDHIFLPDSPIDTGIPKDFLPSLLKKSAFVIASTETLAKELKSYTKNIDVLRNALRFDYFEHPKYSKTVACLVQKIKTWKKAGNFVGVWTAGKTHDLDSNLFLQAAESLLGQKKHGI